MITSSGDTFYRCKNHPQFAQLMGEMMPQRKFLSLPPQDGDYSFSIIQTNHRHFFSHREHQSVNVGGSCTTVRASDEWFAKGFTK